MTTACPKCGRPLMVCEQEFIVRGNNYQCWITELSRQLAEVTRERDLLRDRESKMRGILYAWMLNAGPDKVALDLIYELMCGG